MWLHDQGSAGRSGKVLRRLWWWVWPLQQISRPPHPSSPALLTWTGVCDWPPPSFSVAPLLTACVVMGLLPCLSVLHTLVSLPPPRLPQVPLLHPDQQQGLKPHFQKMTIPWVSLWNFYARWGHLAQIHVLVSSSPFSKHNWGRG